MKIYLKIFWRFYFFNDLSNKTYGVSFLKSNKQKNDIYVKLDN